MYFENLNYICAHTYMIHFNRGGTLAEKGPEIV